MTEATKDSDHIVYRSIPTSEREWSVFVTDDRTPGWWQLVATFANQGRAHDYAEMENDFSDMSDEVEPWRGREDVRAPHPQWQIPTSRIVRRESITHTHIEREETSSIPKPVVRVVDEDRGLDDVAELEATIAEPPKTDSLKVNKLADAATLPSLTEKQAKVFLGLSADQTGAGWISYSHLEGLTGISGLNYYLDSLERKGYARNVGERGTPRWCAAAAGQPRIDDNSLVWRAWSEKEFAELKSVCAGDRDFAGFGKRNGRTEQACIQQARVRGWYHSEGPGRWPERSERAVPAANEDANHVVAGRPVPLAEKPITRIVRRVDLTERPRSITAELMGDPSRKSADDTFDTKAYFIRKGHTVFINTSGYVVDGSHKDQFQVLDLVNSHRMKADLAPLARLP